MTGAATAGAQLNQAIEVERLVLKPLTLRRTLECGLGTTRSTFQRFGLRVKT